MCVRENLGRIFSLCFVTSVFIIGIMGELPNPNACRGDGGILGAGPGGKGSAEGRSSNREPRVISV